MTALHPDSTAPEPHDAAALREQPRQRDLSWSGADLGGDLLDHLDDAPVRIEVVPREAGTVATEVGFVELVGGADAPGEEAAPQRGIGHEADSELAHEGQDLALGVSGPQRVLGLQSRHRTHRMRPRAASKPPSLACFITFLPTYAATNLVRRRDATMVESADAPASVARQSRYA